jgi:hypothetical protein
LHHRQIGRLLAFENSAYVCTNLVINGWEARSIADEAGDAILFQRADGVEAGWRIVQPFLDAWRNAGRRGARVLPGRHVRCPFRKLKTADRDRESADTRCR